MKDSDLLWNRATGEVFGEPLLFTDSGEAFIAFPAEEIRAVYNPTLGCHYSSEHDFLWTRGERVIHRPEGSRMPFLTRENLYPSAEQAVLFPHENANAIDRASHSPTGLLCFDRGDFFARHQVLVDYVTRQALPEIPKISPRIICTDSQRIAFIGDSITDGWNATGKVGSAPGQSPWSGLVTEILQESVGSLRVFHGAVSGSGSASGVEHLDACCREFIPSLLFIAYGMNDLLHLSADRFGRNIELILTAARARNPQMQIVLVSQMSGNPEWELTPAGKDFEFADELKRIASAHERCFYAPVNEFWRLLNGKYQKRFLDLTGNGVNHPNDYGHRVYAAAVASLFVS